MAYSYEWCNNSTECKIWSPDHILIPLKKEDGTTYFWRKNVSWEDDKVTSYWSYIREDDCWNLYRVYKNPANRRLAQYNIGKFAPESIIVRLADKDITVSDCKKIEDKESRVVGERTQIASVVWSNDFDGKSVFELMEHWQKMPYAHVKMVIENEGGSIDGNGIIHKGIAK